MTVLFIFLAVMSLDEFHTKKSHQNPEGKIRSRKIEEGEIMQ